MVNLGHHKFEVDDIYWFARASGDYNPIHVDQLAARRLIAGKRIVHGMFTLLTALNCFYEKSKYIPKQVNAFFSKPVLEGDEIYFQYEQFDENIRIFGRNNYEEVLSISLHGTGNTLAHAFNDKQPSKQAIQVYDFSELSNRSGELIVNAARRDLDDKFAAVASALGNYTVATIMSFSRLVGMEVPGLHSMFAGLKLTLSNQNNQRLSWLVTRHTSLFAPIQISVSGAGICAKLDAFVRPAPVRQPSFTEVEKTLKNDAYKGQRALIIGGSRGLGELVAKYVSAGGGNVCITYLNGETDALAIQNELLESGRSCTIHQLNVENPAEFHTLVHDFNPTHLYYFATSRIRKNLYNYDKGYYKELSSIYVDAFEGISRIASKNRTFPLQIFYPSTTFINSTPRGFAEYVDAKRDGELLCKRIVKENKNICILVRRLPMLITDQTASIQPTSAKPAMNEVRKLVTDMHCS